MKTISFSLAIVETAGPDAFSVAAAVAMTTHSMRLGCAVVPVYTRPPALRPITTVSPTPLEFLKPRIA